MFLCINAVSQLHSILECPYLWVSLYVRTIEQDEAIGIAVDFDVGNIHTF